MTILVYGITGYTGQLISQQLRQAGIRFIGAGRQHAAVQAAAAQYQVDFRVFALDSASLASAKLDQITAIINCAGPFEQTAPPLAAICLQRGIHYLDLAGEYPTFEYLQTLDQQAQQRGVMLMPGVGFGVVPTDCVALTLKQQLPDATQLTLVMETVGGVSQGTLGTLMHDLTRPGVVRLNHQLQPARAASESLHVDVGGGSRIAVLNPWRADLSSAYRSTGIASIKTFSVFPAALRWLMQPDGLGLRLISSATGQQLVKGLLKRLPAGPTEQQRNQGLTRIWGEVRNNHGDRRAIRLLGPEAYDFTAATTSAIVQRLLAGQAPAGYQTPAIAYGPNLVDQISGVRWINA